MGERVEKPILFSGPMVRRLLSGDKTQTRRLVTVPLRGNRRTWPYPPWWTEEDGRLLHDEYGDFHPAEDVLLTYGRPGETDLWVRETWAQMAIDGRAVYAYRASCPRDVFHYHNPLGGTQPLTIATWRPSIFLRREASRLTLRLLDARIERLQCITEEDAKAEGMAVPVGQDFVAARGLFAALWDKINGDRWPKRMASWEANPWVWRLVFKRVEVQHG